VGAFSPTSIPDIAMLTTNLFNKFSQGTRLLRLDTPLGEDILLVESFEGLEAVSELYQFTVTCLSEDVNIELKQLIAQTVTLSLVQSDGTTRPFHGYVNSVAQLGSDGGFARYQLTFVPWLWLLTQRRDNWVFQEQSVVEIIEEVFADYPQASYRLALHNTYPKRSYCLQYRETDFAFVARLMAEEGMFFFFEYEAEGGAAAPMSGTRNLQRKGSHRLVIADHNDAFTESPGNAMSNPFGTGIRFHHAGASESNDSFTRWEGRRQLVTNSVRLRSWDYKTVSTPEYSELTNHDNGNVPNLESYDVPGGYYHQGADEAARYARLRIEALEVQNKTFECESSVRSFTVGSWFELTDHPIHDHDSAEQRQFVVLSLSHQGHNNLPGFNDHVLKDLGRSVPDEAGTYRNSLTAIRRNVPFHPVFDQTLYPKPTAQGMQSAIVVGPQGEEIYTDDQHRVKIQFHWQRDDNAPANERASCWVRVAAPMAGAGWGGNFIPRIGQEVLVTFIEGDIDRPLITNRVYNGANPPAWYAASGFGGTDGETGEDGHPSVLSGFKSKEYQGMGFNQLVLDDASNQNRLALQTTANTTQLNLGHLIHHNGNARQGPRGEGFELRTDAWGAVRAANGLFLSTDSRNHAASTQQDVQEAVRRLDSAHSLAKALSETAGKHNADTLPVVENIADCKENAEKSSSDGNTTQFGKPMMIAASPAGTALTSPKTIAMTSNQRLSISAGQDLNLAVGNNLAAAVADNLSLFTYGGGAKVYAAKGKLNVQAQGNEMAIAADKAITLASTEADVDIAAPEHVLVTSGGAYIRIAGGNIEIHAPAAVTFKAGMHDWNGPTSMNYALPSLPRSPLTMPRHVHPESAQPLDQGLGDSPAPRSTGHELPPTPVSPLKQEPTKAVTKQEPIRFALKLQDIPGSSGAVPTGQPWKIVELDSSIAPSSDSGAVNPAVFGKENWVEALFEGVLGNEGILDLSEAQQRDLYQHVTMKSGRIWVVSGLTAMPLNLANWTSSSKQPNPKRILDSLNFAPVGQSLDLTREDFLSELTRMDGEVPTVNSLKKTIDL
jgi:type VI secretion system secreted protein VgrG